MEKPNYNPTGFDVYAEMMQFTKDYLVFSNEGEYRIFNLGIISTWEEDDGKT